MAYVQVDLDLDELETYDLVEEVVNRLKRGFGRQELSKEQKSELKEAVSDLNKQLNCVADMQLPNATLEDRMKIEHLQNVWGKYSSNQIETLLP